MNVDFLTLSTAVQLANQNQSVVASGAADDSSPRKASLRRRSSKVAETSSANALQFIEAANRSWNDMPDETTALQRRKSLRTSSFKEQARKGVVVLKDVGHKSWTFGENDHNDNNNDITNDAEIKLKAGSSKILPPRGGSVKVVRRASTGGSSAVMPVHTASADASRTTTVAVEEERNVQPKNEIKRTRRLTRRSSIEVTSEHSRSNHLGINEETREEENNSSGRKTAGRVSDPKVVVESSGIRTHRTGPTNHKKFARRNTISHCNGMDNSSGSESSTKQRKSSTMSSPTKTSSGSSSSSFLQKAAASVGSNSKGYNVRFELDHKNRIKRRVSYIRRQTSKTDPRHLWWSEEDLDRIYERENEVYEKFSMSRSYKKKIQRLWGSCSKASGPGVGVPGASKSSGSSSSSLSPEALTHVAGAPCRGLEVDILETVRDRRARVIGSVLDAQETLRDFDPNIRTKVLSARYKNLCRGAMRFARKMGEGDALEAANVYSSNNSNQ